MSTIYDLAEFIATGRPLLWYGAGPSMEVGLPGWRSLVTEAASHLCPEGEGDPRLREEITAYLANGQYPHVLGVLEDRYGTSAVTDICEKLLQDTHRPGHAYTALAKLPFAGYLTTNYERVFERHLHKEGRATTVHSNTPIDLRQVDFDALSTIVKVHGSLQDTQHRILTDQDYQDALHDTRFHYLREFLKSHVLSRRLLIVGYSLSDPDIRLLLTECARILRKDIPVFALVGDIDSKTAKEWYLTFNVQVIRYSTSDGRHRSLSDILELLVSYVGQDATAPPPSEEVRHAQRLFLWHRASFGTYDESLGGALKSLLLSLICEPGESGARKEEIITRARKFLHSSDTVEFAIQNGFNALEADGLVSQTLDRISPTPSGLHEYGTTRGQYDRLTDIFTQQLEAEIRRNSSSVPDTEVSQAAEVALGAVLDTFNERAVELFKAVFREEPAGIDPSLGLLRLFVSRANAIENTELRLWLVKRLTETLRRPQQHELTLLIFITRAFFCFQVLQLDPESRTSRLQTLQDRLALIDSTVLIPALASGHPAADLFRSTLRKAREYGIEIRVLERTIDEVVRAARWAADLVERYGEDSPEILLAAEGRGGYRKNQFLVAYIEQHAIEKQFFSSYIESIFAGVASLDNASREIEKTLEIPSVQVDDLVEVGDEEDSQRKNDIVGRIKELTNESWYQKTEDRIALEADIFL